MENNFPILDEHAAPKSAEEKSANHYDPTPEEESAIRTVEREFLKNKTHRQGYDHKMLEYYKFFRGVQWAQERPTYRHSEVLNFVFDTIIGQQAKMLDTRPRTSFIPVEPNDREFAEILDKVYEADWENGHWLMVTAEVVLDSKIYGTAYSYIDVEEKDGEKVIVNRSVDPLTLYPNPDARGINDDNESVVIAEPMEVSRAKRKWPKHRQYLKPDMVDLTQGSRTDLGVIKFRSPTDTMTTIEGSGAQQMVDADKCLVLTLYAKPGEVAEDKDLKTGEYVTRLKWPNGRKIAIAGGVVVQNSELEHEHKNFPFAKMINYILPREFFGISEVEQLQSPQRIFNKTVSAALDIMSLCGNPMFVVDTDSGVDTDNLFNRPGEIIEKERGSEFRREAGVQVGSDSFAMLDKMSIWFDRISGRPDVTRGVPAQGVTAAKAIEALQDEANTRVRQNIRNMDDYLVQCGELWRDLALEYYTAPRVFRITAKDGSRKYFKFHVQENQATGRKEAVYSRAKEEIEPMSNEWTGNYVWELPKTVPISGRLDVRPKTGSSLPFEKGEMENRGLALFDRGIIDEEEVLSISDYPNKEKVLERLKARQEAMAKQQAQPQK